MGETSIGRRSIAAPTVPWKSAIITLVVLGIILFILDARARDFGTIASALGLYSAGLLGVFGVLNSWRSSITKRRARYQKVEDRWRKVVDRSVKFSLDGSALSFILMLFGVVAPSIKSQLAEICGITLYALIARLTSVFAIVGVIALGMLSLQIVRDINAIYAWNNKVEEDDAIRDEQSKILEQRKRGS